MAYGIAFWIALLKQAAFNREKRMYDGTPSFTDELHTRLRYPPYNASRGERDAIIDQIQEDPDAFWHRVATSYAECPNGRDRCLQDMLNDYRGLSVGEAYRGR